MLAVPIGFIYLIIWSFKVATDPKVRADYNKNIEAYKKIGNVSDLMAFIRQVKYVWDGYKGVLDHNNSDYEYFSVGGDCEDTAMRAYRKFKELKIKAGLVLIFGKETGDVHVDCYYYNGYEYYLVNFGNPVVDISLPKAVSRLWEQVWGKTLRGFGVVEQNY